MIFLHALIILSLIAVFTSLVLGAINMRKTDMASRLRANKLMRIRVGAQFLAIAGLVVLLLLKSKGA